MAYEIGKLFFFQGSEWICYLYISNTQQPFMQWLYHTHRVSFIPGSHMVGGAVL